MSCNNKKMLLCEGNGGSKVVGSVNDVLYSASVLNDYLVLACRCP